MKLKGRARSQNYTQHAGAFTLIEVLVASSIAMVIGGVTLVLLIASAKENRRGLADATVEAAAAALQNKIISTLRVMSATEGVIYSGPSSIIVARGPAPDNPREQLSFDSVTGKVVYVPNRAYPTNSTLLVKNSGCLAVRQVTFSPSLKAIDGTTDNALINVLIKMDDNGASGRPTGGKNPASVWREFSVRMRNN